MLQVCLLELLRMAAKFVISFKFGFLQTQVHAQLQLRFSQWSCWWTLYFTHKLMVGCFVLLVWVRHQKCFHLSFSLWLRLLTVSQSFHQSLQHLWGLYVSHLLCTRRRSSSSALLPSGSVWRRWWRRPAEWRRSYSLPSSTQTPPGGLRAQKHMLAQAHQSFRACRSVAKCLKRTNPAEDVKLYKEKNKQKKNHPIKIVSFCVSWKAEKSPPFFIYCRSPERHRGIIQQCNKSDQYQFFS